MNNIVDVKQNKRVAVGMSGGVDSSVAAYLLKEQGYDVTGVFMQCWDEKADGCRADEDRADAVKVAAKLGIKFVSLDFVSEYKSKVINYFYNEYRLGRTPNPDVMCNKEIKFGMFLEWANKEGFDFVATGHYARVIQADGVYKLLRGKDSEKDQSYFLYLLTQAQLAKTLFPLGNLIKTDVRKLAKEQGFHTFDKKDSVGICFIGEVDIKEFLKKQIQPRVGNVVDTQGNVIGEHDGVWFYTIGQRHGFRVDKYFGLPLYVVGKNVETNELIVGFVKDVVKTEFVINNLHWILTEPEFPLDAEVRIRNLGELYKMTAEKVDKGLKLTLEDEVFGVAPGQSAVIYKNDEVLGGGIIS